jgi:IrrE N-terminal-like domain
MANDYWARPLSDDEIRGIAKALRRYFGVAQEPRLDVRACLKRGTVLTVRGEEGLEYQVRPDSEMGDDDGLTTYQNRAVTIAIRRSVDDAALMGDGRARNTLAHELGHAAMHHGAPQARGVAAAGITTPKWLKPFESAEHQVKVFAPAFLINDTVAESLSSAEEVSIQAGVSLKSASIYFEQLVERRNREWSAENIDRMAREFRASMEQDETLKKHYAADECTSCGNKTLLPVGIKFLCDTCGSVADRFQDGDPGPM